MKFAYADPPYLGCGRLYGKHHPDARAADDLEWHRDLISRLIDEYPDGWALSLHTPSLRAILALCPEDVRVLSWVKPFAAFKPNVGLAYAWEPVLLRGGRRRSREQPTARDWLAENITLKKGLTGAKPLRFCHWIINALNADPTVDILDDLFPGTGIMAAAWAERALLDNGLNEIGGIKK